MPEGVQLLNVDTLITGYGKKQILNGVTLEVNPSEIVALIGHNGAGKSTLLKAIFGLIPIWQGRLALDGRVLHFPNPQDLLKSGVAYVPQGNRVFTDLTVRENLEICSAVLLNKSQFREKTEYVISLFPILKYRLRQRAGTLSGGEKQMLALANALILSPRLLLLDEPSLGLATPLVAKVLECIHKLCHDNGTAILIIEQKIREVLKIAKRVCVLRDGLIKFSGFADTLNDDAKLREVYL